MEATDAENLGQNNEGERFKVQKQARFLFVPSLKLRMS
jgi:hypothetical protein